MTKMKEKTMNEIEAKPEDSDADPRRFRLSLSNTAIHYLGICLMLWVASPLLEAILRR